MIAFFSNNRATYSYFSLLAETLSKKGFGAIVIKDKSFSIPDIKSFFTAPTGAIQQAILYKNIEHQNIKGRSLSLLQRSLLAMLARWYFAIDSKKLADMRPTMIVVWNGLMFRRSLFVLAAERLSIKTCFMENGLLPNTTVCDPKGINARNSMPREKSFYLKQLELPKPETNIELDVRSDIIPKKKSSQQLPESFIFIPFQVDSDSQIIIFSKWIKTMQQLFEVLLGTSKGFVDKNLKLVFKEHPSSRIDYSYLHDKLPTSRGIFANAFSTQELIQKSCAVITVNSTVGIEALMYNKKVIVLGEAFFNIDGLVKTAGDEKALLNCINSLEKFAPDQVLRENFLSYLEYRYLLPGSWKTASDEHRENVASRLLEYSGYA